MQVIRQRYRLTTGALVARLVFTMSFQGAFAFAALDNFREHDYFWTTFFGLLAALWTGVLRNRLRNWKNY